MPRASKTTASDSVELDGYEGHFENLDGGYTVGFETYTADADLTPLFAGLPDDRCQCAHWGYVIKGKVTFKTADGDETFETGDAYYVGPGHTPDALRRHRGRRVQPHREAAGDPRGRREEHGSDDLIHWPPRSDRRFWRRLPTLRHEHDDSVLCAVAELESSSLAAMTTTAISRCQKFPWPSTESLGRRIGMTSNRRLGTGLRRLRSRAWGTTRSPIGR